MRGQPGRREGKGLLRSPGPAERGQVIGLHHWAFGCVRWTAGGRPLMGVERDVLLWEVSSCRVSTFRTGQ
jgi:hypothetical protein